MTNAARRIIDTVLRAVAPGAVAGVLAAHAGGDTVERRGGLPTLTGEVLLVSGGGVEIRTDSGVRQLVPWDQVREVTSEGHEIQLRNFRDTGEMVWRARLRVERHDTALAEPLFERLFEEYRGETNQTALVVSEGVAACRGVHTRWR
jgi:hypothetical protein